MSLVVPRCADSGHVGRRLSDEEARTFVASRFPGVVFRSDYPGASKPWKMVCPEGHECQPRYNNVQQGAGICRTCKYEKQAGEMSFENAEAKAFVLERFPGVRFRADYPGSHELWAMTCPAGHACEPRLSSIRQGDGICRTCGYAAMKAKQRMADAEAKAFVLERFPGVRFRDDYPGSHELWAMTCPVGHDCQARFANIHRGGGICRWCSPRGFDPTKSAYFYGLTCSFLRVLNFGISGTVASRVSSHQRAARKRGVIFHPVGMWLYSESEALGESDRAAASSSTTRNPLGGSIW